MRDRMPAQNDIQPRNHEKTRQPERSLYSLVRGVPNLASCKCAGWRVQLSENDHLSTGEESHVTIDFATCKKF
jgi:hypothetical protein